jgi:hypothetical protein
VKKEGKKTQLKSIVDDPFNERFDSNTRVDIPSTATLLIPAQPNSNEKTVQQSNHAPIEKIAKILCHPNEK